jgi:hypothetical protein
MLLIKKEKSTLCRDFCLSGIRQIRRRYRGRGFSRDGSGRSRLKRNAAQSFQVGGAWVLVWEPRSGAKLLLLCCPSERFAAGRRSYSHLMHAKTPAYGPAFLFIADAYSTA